MLDVSKPLEEIGIQKMTGTVKEAAQKTPATTAEGILTIAQAMEEKLKNVNKKQHEALKNLEEKRNQHYYYINIIFISKKQWAKQLKSFELFGPINLR